MKRAVLFDMDGVLVDNRDVHIEAFEIFCRRKGVPCPREKLMSLFGRANEAIMPCMLNNPSLTPREIERLGNEKEAIYRDLFEATIQPADGLVDFLRELKQHNVCTAVASSAMLKNVEFVLEKCKITSYFDAISHGDLVEKGKPDPAIYRLAAEKLGVIPQQCLVIEDAPNGIEAARRASMKVVAMTTTFAPTQLKNYDLLIHSFRELNFATLCQLVP